VYSAERKLTCLNSHVNWAIEYKKIKKENKNEDMMVTGVVPKHNCLVTMWTEMKRIVRPISLFNEMIHNPC